ncbi:MAG: hypothetical protein IPM45_04995 [Acidimicrobiales bacterium]|nr:hypothetical protein [Acidimicrobiales bacterium]
MTFFRLLGMKGGVMGNRNRDLLQYVANRAAVRGDLRDPVRTAQQLAHVHGGRERARRFLLTVLELLDRQGAQR